MKGFEAENTIVSAFEGATKDALEVMNRVCGLHSQTGDKMEENLISEIGFILVGSDTWQPRRLYELRKVQRIKFSRNPLYRGRKRKNEFRPRPRLLARRLSRADGHSSRH